MLHHCRSLYFCIATLLVLFLPHATAYAQGSSEEGKDMPTPYMMGNIIVVLFAIALFALAVRSARRDFSAVPDEYGNRPNEKNKKKKKKKGKQELDFSRGPVQHPDLSNALIMTLLAWLCCNLLVFFSLSAAIQARDEIRGDPRFKGEGMAQALVILNYILIVIFILNIIGFIVGLIIGFSGVVPAE